MPIDRSQLETFVIRPSLNAIGLLSENAVQLLLGTAAQESALGTYIVQKKMGFNGGLGIYQMEANTFHYIWDSVIQPSAAYRAKLRLLLGYDAKPPTSRMASDLALQTVMTRLFYWKIKEALPSLHDLNGMARYWKKYYNTQLGRGTEDQFIANYKKYVQKDS